MLSTCYQYCVRSACLFFILIPIGANSAHSAALGGPDILPNFVGVGLNANYIKIREADFPNQNSWSFPDVQVVLVHPLNRKNRHWLSLSYRQFNTEADSLRLGQTVRNVGAQFSFQHLLYTKNTFSIWGGAGLEFSVEHFANRHTKAPDGYLQDQFSSRKETGMSLVPVLVSEWLIQETWKIAVQAEKSIVLSGSLDRFTIGLIVQREW